MNKYEKVAAAALARFRAFRELMGTPINERESRQLALILEGVAYQGATIALKQQLKDRE